MFSSFELRQIIGPHSLTPFFPCLGHYSAATQQEYSRLLSSSAVDMRSRVQVRAMFNPAQSILNKAPISGYVVVVR